jgi:hypothetical protein
VNGLVELVVTAKGRLFRVLRFVFKQEKIVEVDVVADPRASSNSIWRS